MLDLSAVFSEEGSPRLLQPPTLFCAPVFGGRFGELGLWRGRASRRLGGVAVKELQTC